VGFFPVISNPTLYRYGQRLLIAALVLSLVFHTLGFLIWGALSGRLPWLQPRNKPETMVVLSSATTISHLPVPHAAQPRNQQSASHPVAPQPPRRATRPQPQTRRQVAVAAAPQVRRELSYTAPAAPPKPQPRQATRPQPPSRPSTAQRLEQDEALFQREVAQLQARNNPMSVATISPRPAAAYRRSYLNISGVNRSQETYEGIVTPTQTWLDGSLRCHYASYDVEYSSGASDKGNIPWPLCYRPDLDPMSLPDGRPVPNGSPVPAQDLFPMQGYVLPPGTYLTQFLRQLYARQL